METLQSGWLKAAQDIRALHGSDPGADRLLENYSRDVYRSPAGAIMPYGGDVAAKQRITCGVIMPERDPLAATAIVLEEQLGTGGAGVVYRGWISASIPPVAVKVYPGAIPGGQVKGNQLAREAQADLSIQHPGIRRVFGQGQGELQLSGHNPELCSYVLMAYIDGCALAEWLVAFTRTHGKLSIERAVEIILVIANALSVVHKQKKSHGDLKLSNVMVEGGRAVDLGKARVNVLESALKIVDFGQAVADGEPRIGGTKYFRAPEQTKLHAGDRRSDIFALGQMLRYLIEGSEPSEEDALERALANKQRWRYFSQQSARDLLAIADRCAAHDPDDRYPDARSLADALGHWLKRQPIPNSGIEYSRFQIVRLLLLRCRLFNNRMDHSDLWALAFLLFAPVTMALSALAAILELNGVDRKIAFDGTGGVNSLFVLTVAAVLCWLTRNSRLTQFTASAGGFFLVAMWVLRYRLLPESSLAESVQLLLTAQIFFMASYFDFRWRLFRRWGMIVLVLAAVSPAFVGNPGFGPFQAMLQGWVFACGELLFSYNLLRRRGNPFRRHQTIQDKGSL